MTTPRARSDRRVHEYRLPQKRDARSCPPPYGLCSSQLYVSSIWALSSPWPVSKNTKVKRPRSESRRRTLSIRATTEEVDGGVEVKNTYH